jgi:hypothetical protein
MPRICPVSLKRRDIYEATAEQAWDKQVFGCCCLFFGAVLAIIRAKTNNIAKLSGPSRFEGKLEDISAYKRKGFEGTVLRMRASSRKDTNI